MVTVASSATILWFLLLSSSIDLYASSASEYSLVVSELTTMQLSPSLLVEKPPDWRGSKVKCERIQIHGLPRIKHLKKFANTLKVKVSCTNPSGCPAYIEICFHRNASLELGMCPPEQWERLSKGLWVKSMSPFDHKILDIRMAASYTEILNVSLDEEFYAHRIIFLIFGIVMMNLASYLGKSSIFYYSSAMAVGVLLLILMILFQGMKLLPTGRQSSLAIFLYSCFVGFGSFLIRYVPRLLRSLLIEIGLPEDLYNPIAIFLSVSLVIAGAWFGFWVVRKHVVKKDGSIDSGVSHFVTWSTRIVCSIMILQSSPDPLLAVLALVGGIVVSLALRKVAMRLNKVRLKEPLDPYPSSVSNSSISKSFTRARRTPQQGATRKSPKATTLSDSMTFYSTFHDTPDRRKYTKDEWDSFTMESTRRALEGLVSSPDFSQWAASHADRITLMPKKEIAGKQRSWFRWF